MNAAGNVDEAPKGVILIPEEKKKEDAGVELKDGDKAVDEAAQGLQELNLSENEIDYNQLRRVLVNNTTEDARQKLLRQKVQYEVVVNDMNTKTRKNWWRGLTVEQLNLILENLQLQSKVSDALKSRIDRVKKEGPEA